MASPALVTPTARPRERPPALTALVAAHAATAAILLLGGVWEIVAGLSRGLAAPFGPSLLRLPEGAVVALGAGMLLMGLLALAAAWRLAREDRRALGTGRLAAAGALLLAAGTFPSGLLFGLPALLALLLGRRGDVQDHLGG